MAIKIGEEVEKTVYDFPVEMGEKERDIFFEYARNNMTEEEFEDLMIEWAMVHIITQNLKELGLFDELLEKGNDCETQS